MFALYRRIAGFGVFHTFPTRSAEFPLFFRESGAVQGVCFSFSLFFLQELEINPSQPRCREALLTLQALHTDAVVHDRCLLRAKALRTYGLTFLKKESCDKIYKTTQDDWRGELSFLKSNMEKWVSDNGDSPTRVLLAISTTANGFVSKHFSPLMFVPSKAAWEVGDTSFPLNREGIVCRYTIASAALSDYMSRQMTDLLHAPESNILKVTVYHVKTDTAVGFKDRRF